MSCGGEEGRYRYRVSIERGSFTMEAKVYEFSSDVADGVSGLLEHLAKPGDNIIVSVFLGEEE